MGRRKAALTGQLADMDLRLLKVFKAVVECGGFTPAEIQLNLANSTISNYISDLEKRLDMRLCERGRAGFSLTEQGQTVYSATMELLSAIDQFKNTINQSHNRILGDLHLGFAEHMLGAHNSSILKTLNLFSDKAPDVKIRISTMSSDDVISALFNQQVDIGITVTSQPYPELTTMKLFDEEMQLYCSQDHPLFERTDEIDPAELRQYRFVESPRLMPGREIHPDMKLWNKQARAHHQEARATLILSGHYLGFLPRHLVSNWRLEKELRPLLTERYSYTNTFRALWRKRQQNQLIIQLFTDCLAASTI
ncbi:LysR family transcriptional regulator [Amphritea sp. 2_MG-2023]|jgi:DNA-binding transcriptional LysR family regulator|uniref:LysR family transcriptional regulator n=1 Tax=Amphritea TaxID=515417 RepID=UPI001C0697C3|nr:MULTISPECIES: LysR family transcriptional regulator [Amphritea]MBU2965594.1 LysR family transcriptional regulator [Amphritea atlantica]MDO6418749.1 LysR family transcriptional regulator [Amphritea sp. 2_MG-2023]MDX2424098.1 LysR family transcriptional regulator [Amphritea sp.]